MGIRVPRRSGAPGSARRAARLAKRSKKDRKTYTARIATALELLCATAKPNAITTLPHSP